MPQLSTYTTVNPASTDKVAGVASNGAVQLYTAPSLIAGFAAVRRTLLDVTGSHTAGRVAGTYGFAQGNPLAISGTGTLYALDVIRIDAADFPTVLGLTPRLSIRMNVAVNDVAPTGNYTFGLHPVTRPATSGAAGLNIYTIGAAVGSTVTLTAPAADSHTALATADFAVPADGFYVVGMVSTATVATSSHMHMSGRLLLRYT